MGRVFNISHHKCGTTSVHRALEILGFKSYHWFNPDELLDIHLKGTVGSNPMFLEPDTAFGDLPITLMYRNLYEAFPDDTFIFIRRDAVSWVNSLEKHIKTYWSEVLPIHTLVYGYPLKASNFDAKVCLRAYKRICEDILEYFQDKPNFHLIELKDLSWKTLCQAVGKPEPSIPFPWENKTSVIS
jgi:hypothetical protein